MTVLRVPLSAEESARIAARLEAGAGDQDDRITLAAHNVWMAAYLGYKGVEGMLGQLREAQRLAKEVGIDAHDRIALAMRGRWAAGGAPPGRHYQRLNGFPEAGDQFGAIL